MDGEGPKLYATVRGYGFGYCHQSIVDKNENHVNLVDVLVMLVITAYSVH